MNETARITLVLVLAMIFSGQSAAIAAPLRRPGGGPAAFVPSPFVYVNEQRAGNMRGARDYATYCSPCHGLRGDGDGPLAAMLEPKPARHSDADLMGQLSDEYLYQLLNEGGPALGKSPLMAAWAQALSEQQIKDLVAYVRSLSGH